MDQHNLKIIGITGSLREISYTRYAMLIALKSAKRKGAETQLIDLKEFHLPFCNEKEDGDLSEEVIKFRKLVKNADAIILGTPEYHGAYSGVLKNAIDLLSLNEFENKLVALIGIAGGSLGASNSLNGLRQITRHLHAWTIPQQVSIPQASSKFNSDGNCTDSDIEERLIELGEILVEYGKFHKEFTKTR